MLGFQPKRRSPWAVALRLHMALLAAMRARKAASDAASAVLVKPKVEQDNPPQAAPLVARAASTSKSRSTATPSSTSTPAAATLHVANLKRDPPDLRAEDRRALKSLKDMNDKEPDVCIKAQPNTPDCNSVYGYGREAGIFEDKADRKRQWASYMNTFQDTKRPSKVAKCPDELRARTMSSLIYCCCQRKPKQQQYSKKTLHFNNQ